MSIYHAPAGTPRRAPTGSGTFSALQEKSPIRADVYEEFPALDDALEKFEK